jgi:tetratricopeptide (TPR) repeat protein
VEVKPAGTARKTYLWIRVSAAVLAALMVGSAFLLDAIKIKIRKQAYEEADAAAAAGNYLVDSTEYVGKNTLERAAETIEGAFRKPVTFEDFYDLASRSIAREEYEKALSYIDVCLEKTGPSPEIAKEKVYVDLLMKKACLLALTGEYDPALRYFDLVLELMPLPQAYIIKAQIYAEQGKADKAAESLKYYLETVPGDYSMRLALIQLYYAAGKFAEAQSECENYLALTDERRETGYFMLGSCKLQNGDHEAAMKDLVTAAELGYGDPAMCYGQAAISAYLIGRTEDVLSLGKKAVSTDSDQLDTGLLYSYMGYSAMLLEKFEDAEVFFTKAIEFGQPEAPMLYYRGISLMAREETETAIADFTAALEGGETTAQCYYNRGACYLALTEYDKALADMKMVAELNEDAELTSLAQELIGQLGG